MKKLLSMAVLFTAFSLSVISCGGYRTTAEAETPEEEVAVEVIEVATCCKQDSAKASCGSEKSCTGDHEACNKETSCAKEKGCTSDSKECSKK